MAMTPRERERLERESEVLRIDMSESSAQPFMDAKIGNVFRYWSPVGEWGPRGYYRFAVGSPTSNVADVRMLLNERYIGDDWKFVIQRISRAKNRSRTRRRLAPLEKAGVRTERRILRDALRRDR